MPPPTGSTAPSAPQTIKLHAHLDPSYTRDPANPFKVTYAYSASATAEPAGTTATLAASEPVPLPEGVLSLYSDGKLECAANVGGETTGSQCPVEYSALGEHKVTTIYSSGETAATETSIEHIEPLKTTMTLTGTYTPREHSLLEWEEPSEEARWLLGTVTGVEGTVTVEGGSVIATVTKLSCAGVEDCVGNNLAVPVPNGIAGEGAKQIPLTGWPVTVITQAGTVEHVDFGRTSQWESSGSRLTPAEAEQAVIHAAWTGPPGYENAEATMPLNVTPQVISP